MSVTLSHGLVISYEVIENIRAWFKRTPETEFDWEALRYAFFQWATPARHMIAMDNQLGLMQAVQRDPRLLDWNEWPAYGGMSLTGTALMMNRQVLYDALPRWEKQYLDGRRNARMAVWVWLSEEPYANDGLFSTLPKDLMRLVCSYIQSRGDWVSAEKAHADAKWARHKQRIKQRGGLAHLKEKKRRRKMYHRKRQKLIDPG